MINASGCRIQNCSIYYEDTYVGVQQYVRNQPGGLSRV